MLLADRGRLPGSYPRRRRVYARPSSASPGADGPLASGAMKKPVLALVVVLVLAAVGGIGFALFERHDRGSLVSKSERACDGREKPVAGAPADLPLGLPRTAATTVLNVTAQGATTVAFARAEGGRDDIVAVRDRVLDDLKGAGYTVVGTDQEPGYEAEAELKGRYAGTVKVSPLCDGLLEVRYKIER